MKGDFIEFTIENPVPDTGGSRQSGNRLAQDNVRERLTTLYNQSDLLRVTLDQNHYLAVIRIPFPYEDSNR